MTRRLKAKFTSAYRRDLKKKAAKRNWDLSELKTVVGLILTNDAESIAVLKSRHNMHRLSGKWGASNECHVANAGDWLVIWRVENETAYFQRTGSHDELFR